MFETESKEYANKWLEHVKDLELQHKSDDKPEYIRILEAHQRGAEFGYNKAKEDADKMKSQFLELCNLKDMRIAELEKANEWQTGEPIKGREIFARNIANCNLLATYFDGAWRNVWNGGIIDFDKITMWRYTGFKNNGEKLNFHK